MTRNLSDADLTRAVAASFDGAGADRYREIMASLVTHLHAFAQDVRLTEQEWFAAIEFLTRVGHLTDDKRQEFVLLSDVLGLSMLVVGLNDDETTGATPATVLGPFFVDGSPAYANGDDLANGAPGAPCFMAGRVLSSTGEAIAGARIEVWQADEAGLYDVQYEELTAARGRGHLYSDEEGRWWLWSVKPAPYPIPDDGPVGELLSAAGRGPMRPAHVHFMVTAPGYRRLITHVFVEGDPYLDRDAVFGVKTPLIAAFQRRDPGPAPDGRELDVPFWTMAFDLVLAPA
jgi:hydroxyquinol 1,2-dioxygenase